MLLYMNRATSKDIALQKKRNRIVWRTSDSTVRAINIDMEDSGF